MGGNSHHTKKSINLILCLPREKKINLAYPGDLNIPDDAMGGHSGGSEGGERGRKPTRLNGLPEVHAY